MKKQILAIPDQFQKHFAFLWSLQNDQPKQIPLLVYRVLRYPQSKDHLVRSYIPPRPTTSTYC